MNKFDIKIYGIHQRDNFILSLVNKLNLDIDDVLYDETEGICQPTRIFEQALNLSYNQNITHRIILQDDVDVCNDFYDSVKKIIDAHPDWVIFLFPVSYVGWERDHQFIDMNTPYIECKIAAGCGIIIPTKYIKPFLSWAHRTYGDKMYEKPDDLLLQEWLNYCKITYVNTKPSLIQHIGDVSIITPHKKIRRTQWFLNETLNTNWECDEIKKIDLFFPIHEKIKNNINSKSASHRDKIQQIISRNSKDSCYTNYKFNYENKKDNKKLICAIIKDEQPYLEEWLQYHLSLGFDKIYLFEDCDSKSHAEITDKYENVILDAYINYMGTDKVERNNRQISLYSKFRADNYNRGWCAFIDIDEFFMLDKEYTLDKLCEEYSQYSCIGLYWKMYNANGHIAKPNESTVLAYTRSTNFIKNDMFWCVKSFVNLSSADIFYDVHSLYGAVDVNLNLVTTVQQRKHAQVVYKKAWINHYFTKSFEDWIYRMTVRGDLVKDHRKFNNFFELNPDLIIYKNILLDFVDNKQTDFIELENKCKTI